MRVLWMVRILVKLGAASSLYHVQHAGCSEQIAKRLRLPLIEAADAAGKSEVKRRLEASLERLERHTGSSALPTRLHRNLEFLCGQISLNRTERLILALAVLLRADNDLHDIAGLTARTINPALEIALVLGVTQSQVAMALEPTGRLRRSGLIEACSGCSLVANLRLRRGGLRKLATAQIRVIDDLFSDFLVSAPPPTLVPQDYEHMSPEFDVLERHLRTALARNHAGVNILVYGPPGTGKSELARTLAQQIGVPLFDVASEDEDGTAPIARLRLDSAAIGLFLLGKRRAIVVFDEVDAIFNDGSVLMGKPSTAESAKAWVNQLLERNQAPVIWIANSIRRIDPAFVRRFDIVMELSAPPQTQRLRLLERECGALVPSEHLRRLSRVEVITPALVTRASKVVRRIGKSRDPGELLDTLLDGVLKAQGHPSLAQSLLRLSPGSFDPQLCNASEDLAELAGGISSSGIARICLYGPPGTGKTAFGHWLAHTVGKPIVLKRVSDLQSPYIGVMEQKLAQAFEQATRESSILQIDEVDSFLQDRRGAQHSWETSQVNEFLTQLENFGGLFIATTNLMRNLDQAALRRFDFKIRMDYLRPEQTAMLLERKLRAWNINSPIRGRDRVRLHAKKLTPGDFAVLARRHLVRPFSDSGAVVDALCAEADLGERSSTLRIGFT